MMLFKKKNPGLRIISISLASVNSLAFHKEETTSPGELKKKSSVIELQNPNKRFIGLWKSVGLK